MQVMAKCIIEDPIDETHPWLAKSGCKLDQLLRDQQPPYRILRRPKKGPDIWIRGGVEYTFEEAIQRVIALRGGL